MSAYFDRHLRTDQSASSQTNRTEFLVARGVYPKPASPFPTKACRPAIRSIGSSIYPFAGPKADRANGARAALAIRLPNLSSFGQCQRVFGVHAKVANRTFELGVAEQDLHRPQISRSLVDQRHLRPAQAVRPTGRPAQPDTFNPVAHQPGILTRADVICINCSARENVILQPASTVGEPSDQAFPGLLGQLELHWLLSLLLDNCCPVSSGCVYHKLTDAQLHQVTPAQFAVHRKVKQCEVSDPPLPLEVEPY